MKTDCGVGDYSREIEDIMTVCDHHPQISAPRLFGARDQYNSYIPPVSGQNVTANNELSKIFYELNT